MTIGREMEPPLGKRNGWITTPNFEKLVLGIIEKDGWTTTSGIISLELQSARKIGKDQSFPPYFDPSSSQDVQEILTQFEERKLVLHRNDGEEIWALTQAGDRALRVNDQPYKASQSLQRISDIANITLAISPHEIERKKKNTPQIKQPYVERKKRKIKRNLRAKKKPTVELSSKNIVLDKNSLKVKAAFDEAVKRLRKHKYGILLPLFREGDDDQGIQVYFSPEGHLCYRPIDKEFVIDIDVAVEVYGKDKILESLKDSLNSRRL